MLSYQISDTPATFTSQTEINPTITDNGDGTLYATPVSTSDVETYEKYVYAVNSIGNSAFSDKATIKITCHPTSTVLTETTYADSAYSDIQEVDVSDNGSINTLCTSTSNYIIRSLPYPFNEDCAHK